MTALAASTRPAQRAKTGNPPNAASRFVGVPAARLGPTAGQPVSAIEEPAETAAFAAWSRLRPRPVALRLAPWAVPTGLAGPDSLPHPTAAAPRRWVLQLLSGPALTYRRLGAAARPEPPGTGASLPATNFYTRTGAATSVAGQELPARDFGAQVQVRRLLTGCWSVGAGLDTTRMQLWQLPSRAFAPAGPDSSGWRRAVPGRPTWVTAAAGRYIVPVPLDSIAMWNIDQFWHAYRNGAVTAAVEVPTGATDTRVYFQPVGFNGLARAVPTAATRWSCNLPLGAPVVAVMLQVRSSQLYYGTQAITTQANQVVRPPLEALSKAEIVRRIRLL